MIVPNKLKKGDVVRVIAPARSLAMPWISDEIKDEAKRKLESLGLVVTFGKSVMELDEFNSSSIKSRLADLHSAFEDKKVKAIFTVIGGYNSIELIEHIDYELIKKNPKILCGYSDITTLQNAIFSKTGLICYSGPHFFDFGEIMGFEYTLNYFKKCLMQTNQYDIFPSEKWSYDKWGKNQLNRKFEVNKGFYWLNNGEIEGEIVGGNLSSFHLLQGTEYFPDINDKVLFLEEDDEFNKDILLRYLASLMLFSKNFKLKCLVLGRFRPESNISIDDLKQIISRINKLNNVPIIANVDFGHCNPKITIPIGGTVLINKNEDKTNFIFKLF